MQESEEQKKAFWKKGWFKKMGLAAFLFFLIKGLVWLAIFFGAWKYFS